MTTQSSLAATLDYYGTLKKQLVDYATSPKFEKHLRRHVKFHEEDLQQGLIDITAVVDQFVFSFTFENGTSMVQRFIDDKNIGDQDAALLHIMHDGLDSFFEVLEQDNEKDLLRVKCLYSDLEYTLMPTIPGGLSDADILPGGFISARITEVPETDVWTPSGSISVLPPASRSRLVELVRQKSMEYPSFSHRNPQYLASATQRSQKVHDHFVTAHGTHLLFGSMAELLDVYVEAQLAPAAADVSEEDLATSRQMLCDSILNSNLADEEDVLLHSHPLNGLSFYTSAGAFEKALAAPAPLSLQDVEFLRAFLDDDTVPAWVLAELINRQLPQAQEALAAVTAQQDFDWDVQGKEYIASLPGEQKPSLRMSIQSEFCRQG